MSAKMKVSRRAALKTGAIAGGGLLLGIVVTPGRRAARAALAAGATGATESAALAPNAFVRVGADGIVTVIANHSEMGQGTYTSLPMLIAEELDADWSKVRVEAAPVDPAYNHAMFGMQIVGGSSSTWTEYERFRRAGATARAMLVAAAAAEWGVDASELETSKGEVIHEATGRRQSYGALADAAGSMDAPTDVTLKDPSAFTIIGTPVKRLDTPEKIDGSAVFGIDVTVPGMLVAVVARPPIFGGKAKSFDATKAKAMPGVRHVVEISRGIAVVADGYWSAFKAREELDVTWDHGPLAGLYSTQQRDKYTKMAAKPGAVAKEEGDVDAALDAAAKTIDAAYDVPYLAHAPMEPLNCVADVRADSCEIWTGTQSQTADHAAAMAITGLGPEQVKLHTTLLGGGFGRRAVMDGHFVGEAVEVSKAVKAPVKVVWSREDDVTGGYYRPSAHHAFRGGLDAKGNPVAWDHRIVCQSFIAGTPMEAFAMREGVDTIAVEGAAPPYAIEHQRISWHHAPGGVPCLWWRSVGHSYNGFVVQSFIDELAHEAGQDPYAFRRDLMGAHPRLRGVLDLAAEKAGWGSALPAGRGRGIASHESFGSSVGQIAEVSVSRDGVVKVHRVVCAVDCGPIVNPDTIEAQIESAIAFALSAVLYGEITFERGRVVQSNFHDYPPVRMSDMPVVETHIVKSTERMGGVGEIGVPPLAAAVTNAIFAATGVRVRRLPLTHTDLRRA